MSKLPSALNRYFGFADQAWRLQSAAGMQRADGLDDSLIESALSGAATVQFDGVDSEGRVRGFLISFQRGRDWPAVAALCEGLVNDLDWPAPVVSIGGEAAYRVWGSLQMAVPLAEAEQVVAALQARYLAAIPAPWIKTWPSALPEALPLVPAQVGEGRWSAYIDPSLGGLFSDETWLDLPPQADQQAELLLAAALIAPDAWRHGCTLLGLGTTSAPPAMLTPVNEPGAVAQGLAGFDDPHRFLLAVMNDASLPLAARLEAAKSLLPYFPAPSAG